MKPVTATRRAPNRSDNAPARGPAIAGIAMQRKRRPAGRAVQLKVTWTNKGSVAQRDAISVSLMRIPYKAARRRGCRRSARISGKRLVLGVDVVAVELGWGSDDGTATLRCGFKFSISISFSCGWSTMLPELLADFANVILSLGRSFINIRKTISMPPKPSIMPKTAILPALSYTIPPNNGLVMIPTLLQLIAVPIHRPTSSFPTVSTSTARPTVYKMDEDSPWSIRLHINQAMLLAKPKHRLPAVMSTMPKYHARRRLRARPTYHAHKAVFR
jgi:hypothetical protein